MPLFPLYLYFRAVLEGVPDIVLGVDRHIVDERIPGLGLEFGEDVLLPAEGIFEFGQNGAGAFLLVYFFGNVIEIDFRLIVPFGKLIVLPRIFVLVLRSVGVFTYEVLDEIRGSGELAVETFLLGIEFGGVI